MKMRRRILSLSFLSFLFCFSNYGFSSASGLEEKIEAMAAAKAVLSQNEKIHTPYEISYKELKFQVHPNVFAPDLYLDTFFFADNIPIFPNDSFLEIGSGTGLISVVAALNGARHVVSTDINQHAVANTRENARLHNLSDRISVRQGSVFEPIADDEKFDLIFWNVPFMHIEKEDLSLLEKALFDPNYEALESYLKGAKQHLTPNGRLLIGFSSSDGHLDHFENLALKHGWILLKIAETKIETGHNANGEPEYFALELFQAVRIETLSHERNLDDAMLQRFHIHPSKLTLFNIGK